MTRCRLSNYLRTERLRAGLSQQELGELLGVSRSSISKMENESLPSGELVVVVAIAFQRPTRDMFPALMDALEYDVMMRAIVMEHRLSERIDAFALRKRAHLSALINRLQFKQPLL